jgi:hypothetical protein
MSSKKENEFGLMAREALDPEVRRTAQQRLHPHDYDSVSPHVADGLTRFVIRVQGGEIRIQSRRELLPTLQWVNSKKRRRDHGPRP